MLGLHDRCPLLPQGQVLVLFSLLVCPPIELPGVVPAAPVFPHQHRYQLPLPQQNLGYCLTYAKSVLSWQAFPWPMFQSGEWHPQRGLATIAVTS
ncbi:hypothetical protein F5J12DRAFT_850746 [Pisolithus orientalis]|uniref:uncharacterized protein n=1 Tax=Pisolithus orientalis TaxID=936130 RepID=UPI002223F280|nr:uncharacterized protein F5J12DRAFT_850746 [Pisolithus orientalis]KAI5997855.1 hypothetical protein F5J12DRAFT_850746 [Pisolithus orientalis]